MKYVRDRRGRRTSADPPTSVDEGLATLAIQVVGLEPSASAISASCASEAALRFPCSTRIDGVLVPAATYLAFNRGRAGR